ncbi:MAG: ParB/RepB/Spo0J family partition protein [Rhodospirillaceae bacterium]|jgi:ParB family transcriptional regulator, chromosome partitioning protein|nr:ParB/RepB/Spo0J family partition protein [Rhodospirillaceae bacterium]MBT4488180.1 ParB/RepB/Spo0J family partition protein [Rhodospirillaceae bacterium]MBT5193333.1 ParB/RepB/Spo0J family partition protein [Rhodospirillaceae bacterium]MBT5894899.1 ParB/RepB/Spo0J family partition protein [Rhodospirillaceae bacterium]MBT6427030.1 ParB/RepB/Spo0J family partition protein [Rhodospirillaceae bacterium]
MTEETPRKGLGRGLSALLAEDPDDQPALDRLRTARTVPVENLVPNRYQPRQYFDSDELKALTQSVRENGILMPILVRRVADDSETFEIVAGERRWRAAQEAQLYEVPIIIKDLDDNKALELALIENVQRQDLTPLEEAEGYRRLMDEFTRTQEDVAQAAGKSRSHVANILRLLGLPDVIKDMLQNGSLSAGHGRALLAAQAPEDLARQVLQQGLNVRQTEQLAKKSQKSEVSEATAPPSSGSGQDADSRAMERQLSEKLGLVVKIKHQGERGEVRISFDSLDQFDEILSRLNQHPNG